MFQEVLVPPKMSGDKDWDEVYGLRAFAYEYDVDDIGPESYVATLLMMSNHLGHVSELYWY